MYNKNLNGKGSERLVLFDFKVITFKLYIYNGFHSNA